MEKRLIFLIMPMIFIALGVYAYGLSISGNEITIQGDYYEDGLKQIIIGNTNKISINEIDGNTILFDEITADSVSPELKLRKGQAKISISPYSDIEVYLGIPGSDEKKQSTIFFSEKDDSLDLISYASGAVINHSGILIQTDPLRLKLTSSGSPIETPGSIILLDKNPIEIMQKNNNILMISKAYSHTDPDSPKGYSDKTGYPETDLPIYDETYADVTSESCSKLGFVFFPESDYAFMGETLRITGSSGWSLGIAQTTSDSLDESLVHLEAFIEESRKTGLQPIIRVLGKNWQDEALAPEEVARFIKVLEESYGIRYVQIWDNPNVVFNGNDNFSNPAAYSRYVQEIKSFLGDSNINIISASLSQGPDEVLGENKRIESKSYMEGLVASGLFNYADFLGSSMYGVREPGECMELSLRFYEGKTICDDTHPYLLELEKIKQNTGKEFEVFITETGFPATGPYEKNTSDLLELMKSDPYVKSSLIHLANGWDIWESSSWLDKETRKLSSFGQRVAERVCR